MPTNAYHPIIINLTETRKTFQSPGTVLSYLRNVSLKLPNKPLSQEMALNLTKVKLFDFRFWSIQDGKVPDSGPQVCFVQSAQLQKSQELLHGSLGYRLLMNHQIGWPCQPALPSSRRPPSALPQLFMVPISASWPPAIWVCNSSSKPRCLPWQQVKGGTLDLSLHTL